MLPWPWIPHKTGIFVLNERVVIDLANRGDEDERNLWCWYWEAVYCGFARERMRFRWKLRLYSLWAHIKEEILDPVNFA